MDGYKDIRAVLFDLDGTLLEHRNSWETICRATFEEFAERLPPGSQEAFWRAYAAKAEELWTKMMEGSLPQDVPRITGIAHALQAVKAEENLAEAMLTNSTMRGLGAACADEGLAEAMLASRDRRLLEGGRLFDDALPVLSHLRQAGLRIGIVTNGYTSTQEMKIAHYGLEPHVDFVVISQTVRSHKPDTAIFEHSLSQAGVAAARAVFVGDTPETDIWGACKAGIPAVLVDTAGKYNGRHSYSGDDGVVTRIQRLIELLDLLAV